MHECLSCNRSITYSIDPSLSLFLARATPPPPPSSPSPSPLSSLFFTDLEVLEAVEKAQGWVAQRIDLLVGCVEVAKGPLQAGDQREADDLDMAGRDVADRQGQGGDDGIEVQLG